MSLNYESYKTIIKYWLCMTFDQRNEYFVKINSLWKFWDLICSQVESSGKKFLYKIGMWCVS